jgi:phenylacetate-coenzyme A ligase PaaK-like adenylate-forming protein
LINEEESLNQFRSALLKATLDSAKRTSFYAKKLKEYDSNITLEEWSCLPIVSKQDLIMAGSQAQYRIGLRCDEVFTSGTTGYPFITIKSDKEQKYISEFYQYVFREEYKSPLVRALQINNPYHGHLVPIPVPIHSHKIGIYDNGSFAHGRKILCQNHIDHGVSKKCTLLVGLERALRAFTMEAKIYAPSGLDSNLTSIISYSQILTRKWRKIFQEYWNCSIVDRFGLSEVFGGATEDSSCGWWFFDPVCLPEVVDIRNQMLIREGVGELLITGLYPFQEAQPMIRYRTGDLVEVSHSVPSRAGILAIRPLGRARYAVYQQDRDGILITPLALLEAVDSQQDIERIPRFCDASQVTDPYLIGHPLYSTRSYIHDGCVIVELYIVPRSTSSPRAVTENAYASVLGESPSLARAIEEGKAQLRVLSVDELAPDLISHSE